MLNLSEFVNVESFYLLSLALTMLLKSVPKQMGQYLTEILGPVWHTLTNSATTYINTTVNNREEADDPTDSDGEKS